MTHSLCVIEFGPFYHLIGNGFYRWPIRRFKRRSKTSRIIKRIMLSCFCFWDRQQNQWRWTSREFNGLSLIIVCISRWSHRHQSTWAWCKILNQWLILCDFLYCCKEAVTRLWNNLIELSISRTRNHRTVLESSDTTKNNGSMIHVQGDYTNRTDKHDIIISWSIMWPIMLTICIRNGKRIRMSSMF